MKQKHEHFHLLIISLFLLIIPASSDALIWLKGTSQPGEVTTSAAILIPVPVFNTTITESRARDIFGIAEFTISEHDDTLKYNKLQISIDGSDDIQIPVPYGALGLSYRLMPNGLPSPAADQADISVYLSVDRDSVTADLSIATDFSFTIERDRLIELLTPFLPDLETIEPYIGPGPFTAGLSLNGELSGQATVTDPTISGSFDYMVEIPEDIFTQEISADIPLADHYQGTLAIEATCNWDNWGFMSPFAALSLSLALSVDGETYPLDPITFDFLPRGTFMFRFDRQSN